MRRQIEAPGIGGVWVECTWQHVGSGRRWDGTAFSTPVQTPAERTITVLAFRQRLTVAERIAIEMASTGNTVDAATVRVWLGDLAAARSVDLDNSATSGGLAHMEQAGLIGAGRAAEILAGPVEEVEHQ